MPTEKTVNVVEVKRNPKKEHLPEDVAPIMDLLEEDLRGSKGKPRGTEWNNCGPYKQLGRNYYHCHLNRSYVAVWEIIKKNGVTTCKIVYAGTRESVPTK